MRTYDEEVQKVGGTGISLCQSQCACQVPTGINNGDTGRYRDSHLAQQGFSVNTGTINANANGAKKVS